MEQMAAELRSLEPWALSYMVFLGQESRKGLAGWFRLRLSHEVTVTPCLTETFHLPAHSHGCQEASVPYYMLSEHAYLHHGARLPQRKRSEREIETKLDAEVFST